MLPVCRTSVYEWPPKMLGMGQAPRARWLSLVLACGGLFGCDGREGGDAPKAELPRPSVACDPDHPCSDGRLCLDAYCVTRCSGDAECAARERCVDGLCAATGEALRPDPCAGTLCGGERPVCHPGSGECVVCTLPEHCPASQPVCDRARGVCTERVGSLCAPCNEDTDCDGFEGRSRSCVAFDEPYERACVPAECARDADCPGPFKCLPSRGVCAPVAGSCTAYHAADTARADP